jgi:benzoyl-CoA reductase/2-hydroxyglutaryl-CoA dehydratase subunit BcrC/BadD/HgdB
MESLQHLLASYASRLAPLPAEIDGRPVVAHVGADVPPEVLTAAGFVPFRLAGNADGSGSAEPYCGPGIDRVAVSQLARLLDGDAARAAGLVLSADCEGSVRLFLYLRELQRLEPRPTVPRFTFLDLVHLPQRTSAVYNRGRVDVLIDEIGQWAGRSIGDDDLRAAAATHDRVRALIRDVGRTLRADPAGPRLTGAEALAVIGAAFVLPPERWSALAAELLASAADLPVHTGTRVFLTGCSHDNPRVYELLESLGAVVVGEDHDWGALAGESPVGPAHDLRSGLVRARTHAAPGAAGSGAATRAAQTARMAVACGAELVVAWSRPYDDAPPWDVPVQREHLRSVGLPLVAVPAQPYGSESGDDVAALLEHVLRDPSLAEGGVVR